MVICSDFELDILDIEMENDEIAQYLMAHSIEAAFLNEYFTKENFYLEEVNREIVEDLKEETINTMKMLIALKESKNE